MKYVALIAGIFWVNSVFAGTVTSKVDFITLSQTSSKVTVQFLESTDTKPDCSDNDKRMHVDLGTEAGKEVYSLLLAASMAGKEVYAVGTGSCDYGNKETLGSIRIFGS